jgi:uncharacterized protein (DUF433 family)
VCKGVQLNALLYFCHYNLGTLLEKNSMIAISIPDPIPLRVDKHGRLRVGNTNVLLDLVIYSFRLGHTPETIIEQYPSLGLDEVYLALGYYLSHRQEIDSYLREQEAEAETFQQEYETQNPSSLTREVLLKRLEAKRNQSRQ